MSKRFYFLSLLLLLSVIYTGCESDDNDTSVEGAWNASELVLTGLTGTEHRRTMPADWSESLIINPDGTFSFSATQDGVTTSGNGEWVQSGNNLSLKYQGDEALAYTFTGNKLVLSGAIPEGSFELILTRD